MELIERDDDLSVLVAHAARARAGEGSMVLVTGEAGAGKSSLLEEFASGDHGLRVVWGACDPLGTPRPLGPLFDVAAALGEPTRAALTSAEHAYQIFDAVAADLAREATLLIIDDAHWADQGTTDLLRHLLRRIRRISALVVVGARSGESADVVRLLSGDIARTAGSASIAVRPLSARGVAQLVGELPLDPQVLHRVTAGNAFFVTQMIEHQGQTLPATVRDAVLARTVGLPAACWEVMNLLACAPGPLSDAVLGPLGVSTEALRRLDELHLIHRTGRGIAFRHDLCRLAVLEVIPPGAEPQLHRRLLAAYDGVGGTDPVIVAHHAAAAGDRERLRIATIDAARYCARSGAHRQSAEFYRMALDAGAVGGPDSDDAELLEALAAECYLIDRLDEAVDAGERALAARRAARDEEGMRSAHNALAVYHWYNADRTTADDHVRAAVGDGDDTSDSVHRGHAFAMSAFLAMQSSQVDDAREALRHADAIARACGSVELAARVSIISGVCDVLTERSSARDAVLDLLAHGPEHLDEIYSSGYSNLGALDVEQRRLPEAAELLGRAIEMTLERDLPVCRVWQVGSRGRLALITGDWPAAVADSSTVLDGPGAPLARIWPSLVRGLVSVRSTGLPAPELDTAWELAARYGEPLRVLPAASALTEQQWLTGIPDPRVGAVAELLDRYGAAGTQWALGDLALWARRAGGTGEPAGVVAGPYRSWLDGDIAGAALEFGRIGAVYDAAVASVESGGDRAVAAGLTSLDGLGAFAVADKLRRDLRAGGATVVPARRRRSTLANAAGLTSRQQEVLGLLAEGLTNDELASRLFLSAKTVDHHVSAILTRLGVVNRRDAVRRGRELGVIDP
ncbi:AAA family ATPase [Tsukamurella sp. NPDC003166]|uniref:ATP-binding protein n=1 Tax=Tsukamurella sp. NPDC003166 TaxID=3154444 RepID=UPI0033AB665A